jgi:hypothetical protein
MLKILPILTLFLYSCGSNSSSNSSENTGDNSTLQSQAISDALSVQAKLFEKPDDLTACTAEAYRQLVYVIETKEFFYCSLGLEWVAIDLKGPKGDQGDKGLDGDNGKDGRDGRDGKDGLIGAKGDKGDKGDDGDDGDDGKDAPYASEETFIHPISGQKWFLGRNFTITAFLVTRPRMKLCPTGSRSPTAEEVQDAVIAGLYLRFEKRVNVSPNYQGFLVSVGPTHEPILTSPDWGKVTLVNQYAQMTEMDIDQGASKNAYIICLIE